MPNWKKVIVSGSNAILASLKVPSVHSNGSVSTGTNVVTVDSNGQIYMTGSYGGGGGSGFPFIGDAVKLCGRILERENIERKYIFLITDGQALGSYQADKRMDEAVEEARKKGISVIAIGMPTGVSKIFSMCMPYEGLRKTIARFLNAYTNLSGDDM